MVRRRRITLGVASILIGNGPVSLAGAEVVSFSGLGFLPGGSSFNSTAFDVSADGTVVVGHSHGPNGTEAYRWTAETGMVGLGDLPGGEFIGSAQGVSADGSAIAGYSQSEWCSEGGMEAFRWTAEGGMDGLGDFWGGPFDSRASAISGDGTFVVGKGHPGSAGAQDPQAFGWTEEDGLFSLGALPGGQHDSTAYAVSYDGSVVVGRTDSPNGEREAFRWTAETGMVGLGFLPGGSTSAATAITDDGSVIFGSSNVGGYNYEGFRWTEETGMVSLGPDALFKDVSADGSVGIGVKDGEAFVWDESHGLRHLRDILTDAGYDMTDWQLAFCEGVSADGKTIVGIGYDPDSNVQAYIAHIPEPASLALLAAGAALTVARRRR